MIFLKFLSCVNVSPLWCVLSSLPSEALTVYCVLQRGPWCVSYHVPFALCLTHTEIVSIFLQYNKVKGNLIQRNQQSIFLCWEIFEPHGSSHNVLFCLLRGKKNNKTNPTFVCLNIGTYFILSQKQYCFLFVMRTHCLHWEEKQSIFDRTLWNMTCASCSVFLFEFFFIFCSWKDWLHNC